MYIKVTVKAGSKKDEIIEKNGRYVISTREEAVEGRANVAAQALLARHLGISPRSLSLYRGADRPSKLFIQRGV